MTDVIVQIPVIIYFDQKCHRYSLTFLFTFTYWNSMNCVFIVCQEIQPVVGDLRYAVLHSMMLTVTKSPQNVQKALKNFTDILNVDVRILCVIHSVFALLDISEKFSTFLLPLKCDGNAHSCS